MKDQISLLFRKSIELGDVEYSESEVLSNWIGNAPASADEITQAEKRLGQALPGDYKELLKIANGFKTSNDSVEPSFLSVREIDYLRNIRPFMPEFQAGENENDLTRSILIAGKDEEQQFLLVPPILEQREWKYWKYANWIPGEEEYSDLKTYLQSVLDFIDDSLEEKE